MNTQGANIINTETSEKNVDLLFDTFKEIFDNPTKYISKKRFDLIKNSYLIKFQKDRINRYQNVNMWIDPPDWSVRDIIKTITYDKLMQVYEKYFNYDDFYLSNDRTEFN
jgi:predicted Zn-dependent peptidase